MSGMTLLFSSRDSIGVNLNRIIDRNPEIKYIRVVISDSEKYAMGTLHFRGVEVTVYYWNVIAIMKGTRYFFSHSFGEIPYYLEGKDLEIIPDDELSTLKGFVEGIRTYRDIRNPEPNDLELIKANGGPEFLLNAFQIYMFNSDLEEATPREDPHTYFDLYKEL